MPDADMVLKISELFGVSVNELLEAEDQETKVPSPKDADEFVRQISMIHDEVNRKHEGSRKIAVGGCLLPVAIVMFLILVSFAFGLVDYIQRFEVNLVNTKTITCTLDGEVYSYVIKYDDNGDYVSSGGDELIDNICVETSSGVAEEMIKEIENRLIEMGGEVEISENHLTESIKEVDNS